MNPDLNRLQAYPFERLAMLKAGVEPTTELSHIPLSIGEPKHAAPGFVEKTILEHLDGLSGYPMTRGMPALREAVSQWLERRFQLPVSSLDPQTHVLPVNGTREALFAFAQAIVDRSCDPLVLLPNPFYQIYEGAALLAGATPWYLNTTADTGFLPDFNSVPDSVWKKCQLLYICSPGNPTGAVLDISTLQDLIELAHKHDFIIAADECYSEIYLNEQQPPAGLLQAAALGGNTEYRRCIVFHSLSKRSNLPGLRSGFVAGDADIIDGFLRYRTYHGNAMSPPYQWASIAAWQDEAHVRANRALYREKFSAVLKVLEPVLPLEVPAAGFYLWPGTPIPDTDFTRELYATRNVTVLPGSFLSRAAQGRNPGANYIRMALVAPLAQCIEAAERIRDYVETL